LSASKAIRAYQNFGLISFDWVRLDVPRALSGDGHTYDNGIVFSTASIWELQIKIMLGKLSLSGTVRSIIDDHQHRNAMEILPITLDHVLTLEKLPSHHKDPFDRLLIAQAISEGMTIVTHDKAFSFYEVPLIW
jgi:PIN domain nuclease of toxin-antitoxin system